MMNPLWYNERQTSGDGEAIASPFVSPERIEVRMEEGTS
jgi:hypothetical protein